MFDVLFSFIQADLRHVVYMILYEYIEIWLGNVCIRYNLLIIYVCIIYDYIYIYMFCSLQPVNVRQQTVLT